MKATQLTCALVLAVVFVSGCSGSDASAVGSSGGASSGGSSGSSGASSSSGAASSSSGASGAPTFPDDGPPAGWSDGKCAVPAEAAAESIANPRTVVGNGSPDSCTGQAFVDAVAKGGVITFDCGPDPKKIELTTEAKVHNDTGPVVIDGGGKITLSGGGKTRILYSNACDPDNGGYSEGVPGNCNEQITPKLTVQNITFVDGSVQAGNVEKGGGGAMWIRGGRTKIVNSRFFNNQCDALGSDVGGGAIRVLDFPDGGSTNRPVYVVNSTFGGKDGFGNKCANGGALSSIGTSWNVYNSLFTHNKATGMGANDGNGGNGGAIYNDGNTIALSVCGTLMENNHAPEGGSAIFFVSNDKSGTIAITDSTLRNNPKGGFETAGFPGMFIQAKAGSPVVTTSTIQ